MFLLRKGFFRQILDCLRDVLFLDRFQLELNEIWFLGLLYGTLGW